MFTRVIFALLVVNILVEAEEEMNELKLNLRDDPARNCGQLDALCGSDVECCPGLVCMKVPGMADFCEMGPRLPTLPSGSLRLLASWSLFGALVLMAWII